MFSKLFELAAHVTIGMTISADVSAGTLTLNVIPQPKDKDAPAALRTALSLTAKPEEFDAQFPDCLSQFTGQYKSLREQIDATNAVLEAAKKDQVDKGVKAAAKVSPKSSPKGNDTKPAASVTKETQKPAASPPAPAQDATNAGGGVPEVDDNTMNLFGDDD